MKCGKQIYRIHDLCFILKPIYFYNQLYLNYNYKIVCYIKADTFSL